MIVRTYENETAVARALAERVRRLIAASPGTVLGLPTGRTPVLLYARLRALHAAGRLDLSRASTFNLDEFLGLPRGHEATYRTFMVQQLFAHVNLAPRRIHFLDGAARDADAECRRYEQAIVRAGGIDLMILGIGGNGHIGFNEPAAALTSDSHRARLLPATRRSNSALFAGQASRVPREALTMGVGTILRSRSIVLVATGAGKADAVRETVQGRVTTRMPASLLQLHGDVTLMLDRAAAAGLSTG